jgi:uncharacterized protein (DUF58 family)
VRRIEISTNRLVDAGVAGDYHSVFKGRGIEFAEVRPYHEGDDIRTIDWNVTARMGRPFIKQFVEERDLTIFLAIDVSGSLDYGSRSILKRELVAEIVALLGFAAVRNHDRVGAAFLSEEMELFLPPRRRRSQVLRIVHELLQRRSRHGTDLDCALAAVLATLKQRAVLFVLSDFLASSYASSLKAASARHDVIAVELLDPREIELPAVAPVVLEDAETGHTALVHGARLARAYARQRETERTRLRQLLRHLRIDHLELRTDRPYLPTLVRFFEERRRRARR